MVRRIVTSSDDDRSSGSDYADGDDYGLTNDETTIGKDRLDPIPNRANASHRSVSETSSKKIEMPGDPKLLSMLQTSAKSFAGWGGKLPYIVVDYGEGMRSLMSYQFYPEGQGASVWGKGAGPFQQTIQLAAKSFSAFDPSKTGWELPTSKINPLYTYVERSGPLVGVPIVSEIEWYDMCDSYPNGVVPFMDMLFNVVTGQEYLLPEAQGELLFKRARTNMLCYVTTRHKFNAPTPEEWQAAAASAWGVRVDRMFAQVFVDDGQREEVMWSLAVFLFKRYNPLRRLLVLHGGTGAGKSFSQNLLWECFKHISWVSTYAGAAFSTHEAPSANAPTHMLNKCKWKRLVFLSESDASGMLSGPTVKAYTGNDPIPHRKCHNDAGAELKPTASFVQLTNTHVSVDVAGEAELGRIVCVKMLSSFLPPALVEKAKAGEPVKLRNGAEKVVDPTKVFPEEEEPFVEAKANGTERELVIAVTRCMADQLAAYECTERLSKCVAPYFSKAIDDPTYRDSVNWAEVTQGLCASFAEVQAQLSENGDVFPRADIDYVGPPRMRDGSMPGEDSDTSLKESLTMVFKMDRTSDEKMSAVDAHALFTGKVMGRFVPSQWKDISQKDLTMALQRYHTSNACPTSGFSFKLPKTSQGRAKINVDYDRTPDRPLLVIPTGAHGVAFRGLSTNKSPEEVDTEEEAKRVIGVQEEMRRRAIEERQQKSDEVNAKWQRVQAAEFVDEIFQPALKKADVRSPFRYQSDEQAEAFECMLARAVKAKKLQKGASIPLWHLLYLGYMLREPYARRRGSVLRPPYTLEDGVVKGVSAKDPLPFDDGTVARDNQPEEGHVASRTRLRSEAPTSGPSKRCVPSSMESMRMPQLALGPPSTHGGTRDTNAALGAAFSTTGGGGQCDAA